MQRVATLSLWLPNISAPAARVWAWLQCSLQRLTMDADELYIRGARDLADLEYRQRRVARDRSERFAALDRGT